MFHAWNAGGTVGLLTFIQERNEDIAKVVIPQHPFITLAGSGEQGEAAMVLHMMSGELKIIANPEDAEAVLNNGILFRMNI